MSTHVTERVINLEQVLAQFVKNTGNAITDLSREVKELSGEMKEFKDEMKEFKGEMQGFKDKTEEIIEEMRRDRKEGVKEWNKKWGELANKTGHIVEDIIFPAVKPVLEKYFGEEIQELGIHFKRNIKALNLTVEIDTFASSENYVFIVKVKSTPTKEKIRHVHSIVERFRKAFPEYKDKKIVPVFASLRFDSKMIDFGNAESIYMMAYREWEYMDILNFDAISG